MASPPPGLPRVIGAASTQAEIVGELLLDIRVPGGPDRRPPADHAAAGIAPGSGVLLVT